MGGTEIYLRSLLAALARIDGENEYFVFTNRETGSLAPAAANFHDAPQNVRAANRPSRILFEQLRLPGAAGRLRCDVLLNPGFTCPLFAPCPNVTIFHDLQHVRHPEYFRWFDLPAWRFLLWAAARRSRALIAVSEATRDDLSRHYGVDAAVVRHGVDPELFYIAGRRQPEPFVLCLSTLHPHKNLDRLVRAYAALGRRDYRLVIAGLRGFHTSQLENLIHSLGPAEDVRLTGWLDRAEILELLRTAAACIQPSEFEGFGLPVLEAMAAGAPLACSDIPPFREIVGDSGIPMFDPLNEDALRRALRLLLESPPDMTKARQRAREFSWDAAARETLAVLKRAADKPRR
ncbi:MAG TPA: glycosyltransferase family 1 protein [Bryobacteraceae bacterium]|nr:glycosyltransferase family 1 protein [Bryobacteraceae bacterium]